jgi:hypothetical protein
VLHLLLHVIVKWSASTFKQTIIKMYINDLTVQAQHQSQTSVSALWSWWDDLLLHNSLIYVLENEVMHIVLLQIHHNMFLVDHFSIKKIIKLLFKNYYFSSIWIFIKVYIFTYNFGNHGKVFRYTKHEELFFLSISISS